MSSEASRLIHEALDQYWRKHKVLPGKITVSPALFSEFTADVEQTGHAVSVWGVPVVQKDVTEIECVGPPVTNDDANFA